MNINSSQNMKTLLMIKLIIDFYSKYQVKLTDGVVSCYAAFLKFVLETLFFVIPV